MYQKIVGALLASCALCLGPGTAGGATPADIANFMTETTAGDDWAQSAEELRGRIMHAVATALYEETITVDTGLYRSEVALHCKLPLHRQSLLLSSPPSFEEDGDAFCGKSGRRDGYEGLDW